uniref:Uncharacterized protein n=1 Tax=uncultured prokaryote TaxID=198431 RepID=A0A0H5Q5Z8_9ZZZZ|nr:hypothetical protein [uncultured prokaryote]
MTVYKFQATSVDYWRGNPHRWQNSFHFDVSNDATAALCLADFATKMDAFGTSTIPGGLASVACYNTSTGGVPVGSTTFFPWDTVGSWVPFSGAGPWGGTGHPPIATESSAKFRTQAGVGRTGKPVYVGFFWHSFIASAAAMPTASFSSTVQTAAEALYDALQTLSDGTSAAAVQVTPGGGSIAGSGALLPYVENHQRTRGRRRKSVTIDGKRYYPAAKSASVVPVEAD